MLQIQPELDIVLEFIKNEDYKYIRLLGMLYFRLVCTKPSDIYSVLEPLYSDYRKIAFRETSGKFSILHMDEVIDKLLREDRFCEVMLPRIPKRWVLQENGTIPKGPRISALQLDDNDDEANDTKNEP